MTSALHLVAEDLDEELSELTEARACLMLDAADRPPQSHAGGLCKCCGYYVEPTHDSVDCAFKLAAERETLRKIVLDFGTWAYTDGVACTADACDGLGDLVERAAKAHVLIPIPELP